MKLKIPHLSVTQAGITSLFVSAVGYVVAYVPSFAPDKQILISGGTAVIAGVFLIANALHAVIPALVSSKLSFADVEHGVEKLVEDKIGALNLPAIARDAASGNLNSAVQAELNHLLASMSKAASAPAAPAVPVASSVASSSQVGS